MTDGKNIEDRVAALERHVYGENGRSVGIIVTVRENSDLIKNLARLLEQEINDRKTARLIEAAKTEATELLLNRIVKYGGVVTAVLTFLNVINVAYSLLSRVP